jgi:hypothetical protein
MGNNSNGMVGYMATDLHLAFYYGQHSLELEVLQRCVSLEGCMCLQKHAQ